MRAENIDGVSGHRLKYFVPSNPLVKVPNMRFDINMQEEGKAADAVHSVGLVGLRVQIVFSLGCVMTFFPFFPRLCHDLFLAVTQQLKISHLFSSK